MRPSPRSLVLGVVAALVAGHTALAGPRLIDMARPSDAELQRMRESGAYEFLEVGPDRVLAVEDQELLAELGVNAVRPLLLSRGAYRIEAADLDDVFAPFRAQGSEGAYHSLDEVTSEIAGLAAAHPERVELVEIGRSIEDRPITAVRVGARDGVERPAAIFMGMIHAREWISTEVAMAFLNRVVAPEPELAEVLAGMTVYVIPVLNPDGFVYSQTSYTWWRGNRRPHSNGKVGVDLNRNFPTGWGIGSSSYPGSQTYRGAEPLSEPESAAFDALVNQVRPVLTMTWHAYGKMVLLPYGYKSEYPARQDRYAELGPAMQQASGYTAGAIHQLIGTVGGATDDHFIEAYGTWVATLELGTSFIPPESSIPDVIGDALPASLIWLKAVPSLVGIDPREAASSREAAFRRVHGE